MDRTGTLDHWQTEPLLPSRRPALAAIHEALANGRGLALLTGEPGSGKTWLIARLRAEIQANWSDPPRWLSIDLATSTSPADLLWAIASGIGLVVDGQPSADVLRLRIAEVLSDWSADGHRLVLVVDEAHLASVEVFEELRVLSNRLGQADGLEALTLVGQSPLIRRLGSLPLSALESRLAVRAHLGPIDADEADILLGSQLDELEVERLHRDAAGNPARLLRMGSLSLAQRRSAPSLAKPEPEPATTESVPITPLVPSKPPIRVEEGLIEVGWDADSESSSMATSESRSESDPEPLPESSPAWDHSTEPDEELLDDPYAALQAWNEWSAGHGRAQASGEADADGSASRLSDQPHLRAESHEEFAPYSQLFARDRTAKSED